MNGVKPRIARRRAAVLSGLLAGRSCRDLALAKGFSNSTIASDRRWLLKHQVIVAKKKRGIGGESIHRGPRYAEFERTQGGAADATPTVEAMEPHGAVWKQAVDPDKFRAPDGVPVRSLRNGTISATWVVKHAGNQYRLQVMGGPHQKTLKVWPKRHEIMAGPTEVHGWRADTQRAVGALVDNLAKKKVLRPTGPLQWAGPPAGPEFAVKFPGFEPTGWIPGDDGEASLDNSPGRNKGEAEVRGETIAARLASLPTEQDEQNHAILSLDERVANLSQLIHKQNSVSQTILDVVEKLANGRTIDLSTVTAIVEAIAGHRVAGESPDDQSNSGFQPEIPASPDNESGDFSNGGIYT